MIPADGSGRAAKRDADRRSCQRDQARTRGQVPAPPVRTAHLVRLQFPRGHVLATPDAACVGHDPELWFSPFPQAIAQATAICHRCPHQASCLSGAIERRETYGIWGGTDFNPRHQEDVA
jgi:WhiB family redox-sensing transcriptional regulator